MARIAVLGDIHGNAVALEAVRTAVRAASPDVVMIVGDFVLYGPDPARVVDIVRDMESEGALVIGGNTDIAVADLDLAAAFPWMVEGVSESIQSAVAWAHEMTGPERLEWLRRLPSERRVRTDELLTLACHASPGSMVAGFDVGLDPSVATERLARTDARIVACGHTHLPEVRDLGWKMIVNAGSAGFVFDGDPTASWALIDTGGDEIRATIERTPFDVMAVANAISSRGLAGDVYRAATVRTGKLVR